jgi:hypothetical protein
MLDEKDRANYFAIHLSQPTTFLFGVKVLDKLGQETDFSTTPPAARRFLWYRSD